MLRLFRFGVLMVGLTLFSGVAMAASKASTRSYKVSSLFREVSNYTAFTKKIPLRREHRNLLKKNLFVCTPSETQQLFHIYEHNDYNNLPSFVTTDTVLQLYHIFFDFALRTTETESLMPVLQRLTAGMLKASVAAWESADDPKVKAAALKNVAYFGVASRLLGRNDPIPAEAGEMVRKELALADRHQDFDVGAIFPYKIDYSQFVPRGHYTRSDLLKKFFRSMMWYGLVPFAMEMDGRRTDEQTRQGLIWVHTLYSARLQGDWNTIYGPTAFFVGLADDLTPAEWKKLSDQVYGANADVADFADNAKLAKFCEAAAGARRAAISPRFGRQMGVPAGTPRMIEPPLPNAALPQLRFMGQRYIPDSEILQRLSMPIQRVFPSGLDIMGVLGSKRAVELLDTHHKVYNANNWTGYKPERDKLTREFAGVPQSQWLSNLYWSWLYALKALNQPSPAAVPSFMRNTAWQDKSLNTALASWAELRHDTILYAKQSVVECGGDGQEPPFVKGYVEPNLLFYDRLIALNTLSRTGLTSRKILPLELKERFERFDELLKFLRRVSAKELAGQALTKDEYLEIRYLGGKIENLTTSVMEGGHGSWELLSQTDKNMAVVADVHTGAGSVLEEGVGHANEIYVIVPIEGKLSLTRGATFSYYEFKQPMSDRLTDEKWQAALKRGTAPEPPVWTKSFLAPAKARRNNPSEFGSYDSGC